MSTQRVYLVRHGDALARASWKGEDSDRPLSGRGSREARAVADRFETGPLGDRLRDREAPPPEPRPARLVSSIAERCLATLRPLAGALGQQTSVEEQLSEGSDPRLALERLEVLAASGEGGTVACTHGDVIWGILALLEEFGLDLPAEPDAKKGSIWALDVEGGKVLSARYVPPGKV